jgi:cytosine/adenosine deaminase-related metal-dependent hydrolase
VGAAIVRGHFRDANVLPEGKVLEMCTIDAARALGLEDDIGSLEVGKKADIVLLDGRRPHLWPPVMPLNRITHFANAADVNTVVVNGQVLLKDRKPLLVSLDEVLSEAQLEANRVFADSGHAEVRFEDVGTWGNARRWSNAYMLSGSEQ